MKLARLHLATFTTLCFTAGCGGLTESTTTTDDSAQEQAYSPALPEDHTSEVVPRADPEEELLPEEVTDPPPEDPPACDPSPQWGLMVILYNGALVPPPSGDEVAPLDQRLSPEHSWAPVPGTGADSITRPGSPASLEPPLTCYAGISVTDEEGEVPMYCTAGTPGAYDCTCNGADGQPGTYTVTATHGGVTNTQEAIVEGSTCDVQSVVLQFFRPQLD